MKNIFKIFVCALVLFASACVFAACGTKTTIEIYNPDLTMEKGTTQILSVVVSPSAEYTLSSSDTSIISLNGDIASAVKEGQATITATSGKATKSITITVTEPAVTITMGLTSVQIQVGADVNMTVVTSDGSACTYTTSNAEIATVDGEGNIKAIAEGECVVTATTVTGYTRECSVTVTKPEITFNATLENTTVLMGTKPQITVTKAEDDYATFTSSDKKVATVSSTGIITPKAEGKCTITVTSLNTEESVTIEITVAYPAIEEIAINAPEGTVSLNSKDVLTVNVTPAEALSDVTWATSNNSIIDIDESGAIEVEKSGTVTITATSKQDATKVATLELTAKILPQEVLALAIDKNPMIYNNMIFMQTDNTAANPRYNINGSVLKYYLEPLTIDTSCSYRFDLKEASGDWTINTTTVSGKKVPYERTADEINMVVVHDAGAAGKAKNTALWGNGSNSSSSVSYGYTVGIDGVFQILDDKYIGWHAGDGTDSEREFKLFDSGVKYVKGATLTVDKTSGKFKYNDTLTNVYAGRVGYTTEQIMANPSACTAAIITKICDTGIVIVKGLNGNAYINNTYVNGTYSGAICNCGGGYNGIGIESMVDTNDDIYITWHRLAKLVAYLCIKNNIPTSQVIFHNGASNKHCPNTMLTAGEENRFKEMVEIEYLVATELADYNWSLTTNHPELISEYGHITTRPTVATNIEINLKLTNKNDSSDVVTYKTNTVVKAVENK